MENHYPFQQNFAEADTNKIAKKIAKYSGNVDYTFFSESISLFVQANQHRLAYLKDEAFAFVQQAAKNIKKRTS